LCGDLRSLQFGNAVFQSEQYSVSKVHKHVISHERVAALALQTLEVLGYQASERSFADNSLMVIKRAAA
jgi:hypothetical protein